MFELNNLTTLKKDRKRVGRGGSRGGTSGRGHKGQNARSGGKVRVGFEGGQMPLHRRLPKRGFNNTRFADETQIVSLEQLDKRFEAGQEVNRAALIACGLVSRRFDGRIKVLAGSAITKKLTVIADAFSKGATEAIQSQGGEARVLGEE